MLELQQDSSLKLIVKRVESGLRCISDFALGKVQDEFNEIAGYRSQPVDGTGTSMKASKTSGDDVSRIRCTVTIGSDRAPPTGTCAFFLSSRLPCRHILSILVSRNIDPFQVFLPDITVLFFSCYVLHVG